MTQETLNYFIKKGFLLDRELAEFFKNFEDKIIAEDLLNKISSFLKTRIINKAMIISHLNEISPFFIEIEKFKKETLEGFFKQATPSLASLVEKPDKIEKLSPELKREIFRPDFKILSSNILPNRKIEVGDFVTHFKNRYNFFRDLLKNSNDLVNLTSINKVGSNRDFSVIGMVYSKRTTKNNNILFEVEDPTGRISAVVNQSKPELFEKAKEVVMDDVIGLRCMGGREIAFVNNLIFLDSSLPERKKTEEEVYALFTSDIHLGSNNFLEENFAKFIEWLNGEGCSEDQKNLLKKIKYLFIVGDNVDGVGIFPGQEELLKIKDIKDQYIKLAGYLNKIPKYINIIMCPGQHDAVRVPEPQPPIGETFGGELTKISNLSLVSNPSLIELESQNKNNGIKVLMYHGASIHEWIENIESLRLGEGHLHPAKAIRHMLKHRHLSPTHSGTTYVPDRREDPLAIIEIPDVITTGEVHRVDIDRYNKILIICNSCWQSTTAFEEKVGNQPDPCKVPMLNLKTREIKILDFSGEEA